MKRQTLLPLAILGLGVLGAGILYLARPRVEPKVPEILPPVVRVARVEPQDVQFVVEAQGTVVPRTESALVPQVSGVVIWVSPALVSGGFFEAGDPLVRIDPADYQADLERARAAVARAESEWARARKEQERQRHLASHSAASQSRIDDAENDFLTAEAVLRDARSQLDRAQRDLARTELVAPYAGRVREERVDVGQFVSRGQSIATVYAVDHAEVRLPVPDRELAYVDLPLGYRSGAGPASTMPAVRLRAEFAGAEHTWEGRIVRTEGEIDPKSRMVTAVASIDDPYGRDADRTRPPLAVGLFVEAEIEGRRVTDASVLPRTALREGGVVFILDEQSRLRRRQVEVLRVERDRVVIGEGLATGERVCVSPLPGAVDGMRVRVAEAPAEIAELRR